MFGFGNKKPFKRGSKRDIFSARKSIILFFHTYLSDAKAVKRRYPKPIQKGHKYAGLEDYYTGQTTCIKTSAPGGVMVPERRSKRAPKYRLTGRFAHKPWPFTRKVVEKVLRPVDNLKWGIE